MKSEKQTELVKRAKKFHRLWEKGYSVADAAVKMGISKSTIYDQLDKYAEINGVVSRLTYISEYSTHTITDKNVALSDKTVFNAQNNEFDDLTEKLELKEILLDCDKWMEVTIDLIESLNSIIRVYFSSLNETIKEEKV